MRLAFTADLTRQAEAAAVASGTSLGELMERAGAAVAAEAAALVPQGAVAVVTGRGNNGGDGWVAARCLRERGRDARVLALAGPESLQGPAADAAHAAVAAGVPFTVVGDADMLTTLLEDASLVIDAVLGTGLTGDVRPADAEVLAALDDVEAAVLAVDVPSGIGSDDGSVRGTAVHADVTVTFGWPKAGLLLFPGAEHAGEIVLADIGLAEPDDLTGALEVWEHGDLAALMPLPRALDDKTSRGRVVVAGGAPGLTGAVRLSASAALRMGAGYVTVAVPAPSMPVIECALVEPVKRALAADADGALDASAAQELLELCARADSLVLGPGLGRADTTRGVVLDVLRGAHLPVVLDADGLHALGDDLAPVRARTGATVLTPHAGEAARLLGVTREAIDADRPAAARALAGGGVVCVLKGPRTLASDGERVVVTMTGGPSLATLGTGDVLAGMIGALLAQGLDPLEAGALGAHLHGAAGDAAAEALTSVCCTALDVLTYLPEAVRRLIG